MEHFEECERCYIKVSINEMIVKGTPDGNCIYCPKCMEYLKFLDTELIRLCKIYNLNPNEK